MTRALVITNPAAARTDPIAVEVVMATLRSAGWDAQVLATGGHGDAGRLAAYAVQEKMDVCAVFGGDGTTMQAAAALVGSDVTLGLIPGGTGNLLAGNLRIPLNPARAARVLVTGVPRRIDLGRLDRDTGSDYFAVACGAGYDAVIMGRTQSVHKRRWGMLAYVATTIRFIGEIRSREHHITVDGVEYEAHASMVVVANCGEIFPPLIKLRTGIEPDDGLLDVLVVRANGFGDSVRAVWDLLREGHGGDAFVGYARGRVIRVETHPVQPMQLDGDSSGFTPFTATCVPGAIRIMTAAPERRGAGQ
jgi:diacylglycerol kinase (ATP)